MIDELTKKTPNVHTITKLPHDKYTGNTVDAKDTKYKIHRNRATANEMLSYWLSHLN